MNSFIKKKSTAISLVLIGITLVILFLMGSNIICPCGTVKMWEGDVWNGENSQHLTDWYTLSHLAHGFIFFWLLHVFFKKKSFEWRLVVAIFIEAVWEIIENSQWIIERYRATTSSQDYNGDSIVNSMVDLLACWVGFLLAKRFPTWVSIAVIIFMELIALYFIRDNLTLNVVMLFSPIQAIKDWQMAAPH